MLTCLIGENLFSGENPETSIYPENASIQQIRESWSINNCDQQITNFISNRDINIQGRPINVLSYNENNSLIARNQMNNFINQYLQYYSFTDNKNSDQYTDFQNTILNTCNLESNSGICDNFLTSFCSNFNYDQMITSPTLLKMCSCYIPGKTLVRGTTPCLIQKDNCVLCDDNQTSINNYNCVSIPSCSPLCRSSGSINRYNLITGTKIECPQNICVITDEMIRTEGTVNFNNFCFGCNKTGLYGCNCLIDISDTYAQNINIRNFCGANSTFIIDGNNVSEEELNNRSFFRFKGVDITWIIILLLFLLIIILILLIYFKQIK